MPDERTAETPQGTPGQRALGAMESAVRRARESASAPPVVRAPAPPGPTPDEAGRGRATTRGSASAGWRHGGIAIGSP